MTHRGAVVTVGRPIRPQIEFIRRMTVSQSDLTCCRGLDAHRETGLGFDICAEPSWHGDRRIVARRVLIQHCAKQVNGRVMRIRQVIEQDNDGNAFRQLVEWETTGSFGPARTILTSGDSVAEGALISEIALREPHPIRYIVRGTKLFADISWMGRVAELRVNSAAQVHAMLMPLPVDLVVMNLG